MMRYIEVVKLNLLLKWKQHQPVGGRRNVGYKSGRLGYMGARILVFYEATMLLSPSRPGSNLIIIESLSLMSSPLNKLSIPLSFLQSSIICLDISSTITNFPADNGHNPDTLFKA
jgi:hypothetical protein